MKTKRAREARLARALGWLLTGGALLSCSPDHEPQAGSQTNWLRACETDGECGSLGCVCGTCTRICEAATSCSDLAGATCVSAQDAGLVALCGGTQPSATALCLSQCDPNRPCATGQICVAGLCNPAPPSSVQNIQVLVDPTTRYQTLVGLGATLAYAEGEVVSHPRKAALYQALFGDLGLDILRLRNRYGYVGDDDLSTAAEITEAAAASLGRPPTVLLTSWSPPVALKANGALTCHGNVDSCTLARSPTGTFDYATYADYWRSSLDAYSTAGVMADYIGIQNNPDFVPVSVTPGEGCQFLPTEGNATVSVNGTDTTLAFPGYAQALQAVLSSLATMTSPPKIVAPDVSTTYSLNTYLGRVDLSRIAAIGHHLYSSASTPINPSVYGDLAAIGRNLGRPLFQTEMASTDFDTALLLHNALAVAGAAAYMHNVLAAHEATAGVDPGALVSMSTSDFSLELAYQALQHYARYTDPGWVRVQANSGSAEVLASAWLSPTGDALTVVLVNAGTAQLDVELPGLDTTALPATGVFRTTFDGLERFTDLGTLDREKLLRLPGHSMVTVVLHQ